MSSRSTAYRVVAVVTGCVLLALTLPLMPGRLDIPRPSGDSGDTIVSSKPTLLYGSSTTENSNQTVSQLLCGFSCNTCKQHRRTFCPEVH